MNNIVKLLVGSFAAFAATPCLIAANVWDGGGTNANWDTLANWDDDTLPVAGADVTFGSGFGSGTAVQLNGNRSVGLLTLDYSDTTTRSLNGSTLTINSGITKTAATASGIFDIFSTVSLPNDIVINQASTGRIGLRGGISGAGKITINFTASTATSVFLGGNNTGWSGGLSLGAAPANSSITVSTDGALGTGDVVWTADSGPSLGFNSAIDYTVNNNLSVQGAKTISLSTVNSSDKSIVFNGHINGTGAATMQFVPRTDSLTNLTVELNNANTDTDAASRLIFQGSTNDTTGKLGVNYVIGNDHALDWGRVILGQGSTAIEDIGFLYKDGVKVSHDIELNDGDSGAVTMGVQGENASAIHDGAIKLANFNVDARSKSLTLTAGEGSLFTVTGALTTNDSLDTLIVTKTGNGTVALTNDSGNLYYGPTTVSAGTLLINNSTGSGTGTGAVVVASGAVLRGNNRIAPAAGNNVTINGTLSPGETAGVMTFNLGGASRLVFGENSTLAFDLGTASDLVDFATAGDWLDGSGNVTLALNLGAGFDYASTYTIFGDVTTDGFSLASITGYDSVDYTANFAWNSGANRYELSFTPVPEPGTAALLLCAGLAGAGYRVRRRRTASL